MDTDHIFHELFRNRPDWFREFTGLPLPDRCSGRSLVLKRMEVRCDLVLEPENPAEPCVVVEFQLYHDHSIFNRVELERQLLWKSLNPRKECRRRDFRPREVEALVLFGSRTELPFSHIRHPLVRVLFIDELLDDLERRRPDSPLLAALLPLRESLSELEKKAAGLYRRILGSESLPEEDRKTLEEIFLNLLLQRFRAKTWEELRKMIAELTPLHKTRAGKDLLQEGIEKGIEKGEGQLVRRMAAKGKTPAEIAELTDLPLEEVARLIASRPG